MFVPMMTHPVLSGFLEVFWHLRSFYLSKLFYLIFQLKIKKTALIVGFRPESPKKTLEEKGFRPFFIKNGPNPVFPDEWSGPNGLLLLECPTC
jgi:hypothetical protein